MRIVFVCTGNVCRSPLAERLAATWAGEFLSGSPELGGVQLVSAGVEATVGEPMDRHSAEALMQLGGDPAGFRSQVLDRELLADAALVFTMTRKQRDAVLGLLPRGLRRTFTLTEAADLLQRIDAPGLRLLPLTQRAQELGRRLDAARARRFTTDSDDVADPISQRKAEHEAVASTIATALRPLAEVLFPSVRSHPAVRVEDDPIAS
ncbi:hypothetical protein A7K94_0200790 [Modestobacter sp. VKM Ac-2676]|nr:hypothetical protein A7K94_0200790 [Modestobacter sp. VKM Ac-2676]